MKQNNPCYLFGRYEPDTDSVIVNAKIGRASCRERVYVLV